MQEFKATKQTDLAKIDTLYKVDHAKKELKSIRKEINALQDKMYAHGKYAMLICIQGMDTAGKDSLIREVFKDVNARGVEVHSFKVPTEKELKHDFLWRHYIALPERGKIGVFNRTHYENVLVTRVHKNYIFGENIPKITSIDDLSDEFYNDRMKSIIDFENHITKNGTIILKFFLHISKEEQKRRLLRRLNLPEKNWKFSAGDLKERNLWNEYQNFYQDAIQKTTKDYAPWFVIPSDDKQSARVLTAKIILKTLQNHQDIVYPELDKETKDNINVYKSQLNAK